MAPPSPYVLSLHDTWEFRILYKVQRGRWPKRCERSILIDNVGSRVSQRIVWGPCSNKEDVRTTPSYDIQNEVDDPFRSPRDPIRSSPHRWPRIRHRYMKDGHHAIPRRRIGMIQKHGSSTWYKDPLRSPYPIERPFTVRMIWSILSITPSFVLEYVRMSTPVSVPSMFIENTSRRSDGHRALVYGFSALPLMRNMSHSCETKDSRISSTGPTSEKPLAHTIRRRADLIYVNSEFNSEFT